MMEDRFVTRSSANKIDSRLQAVITSPYIQPQLHYAKLINRRGQATSSYDYLRSLPSQKRRRQEAITPETILRAFKNDQSNRLNHYHQVEIASRRATYNSFEILSRRHRKQAHENEKSCEKSIPVYSSVKNNGERQSRVTSARSRKLEDNKDLTEPEQKENHIERFNKVDVRSSSEPHTCEITMSYGTRSIVNSAKPVRNEIIVLQQLSTGKNLVIYRGFLTEGESFSFKSQRRPTSAFALAFYCKGFIDSIVNDCCEFGYRRRNQHINEYSQFSVVRVQNAIPCEKCRKKYAQKTLPSNNRQNSQSHHKVNRRYLTPTPNSSADNHEKLSIKKQDLDSKQHQRNKKIVKHRRHSTTMNPMNDNIKEKKSELPEGYKQRTTDKSEVVGFSLLELALVHEQELSTQRMQTNSVCSSLVPENTARHSTDFLEEKISPTPSQQHRVIQEWVDQIEADPLDIPRSTDSLSITNTENTCQMYSPSSSQQLQIHTHPIQSTNVMRHDKNVENFIYILDGTLQISDIDLTKLRGVINFGLTFNNINDKTCIEYVSKTIDEQIIMILSRTSVKNLDRNLQNFSQIRFIYVVDNDKDLSYDSRKIQGTHANISCVCSQLEKDIMLCTSDLTKIVSYSDDDDINNSTFAYTQVLKDILLEIDETTDLKKDMLEFCRQQYIGNEIQLRFIDEFEYHFRPDQAIAWFTRQETFLFKMLTRAFRILDPDVLFQLRFFIQHLHQQLKSNLSTTPMTVYRTQYISTDDIDSISKKQNGLLTFNQFLMTCKTEVEAQQPVNIDMKLVRFEIELNKTIPMMEIKTNPENILITIGTVFRISSIKQIDKEIIIIKLTLDNDILKTVQQITKNIQENTYGPFPLFRITKLMKQMKNIKYTEYFCNILVDYPLIINDEAANLTVAGLFHMLCCFYYEKKQYDHALEHLQTSLKVYLRILSSDDIKLTTTYNNMGSIYHRQGLYEQAFHFHKKAYDIQVHYSNFDPYAIAAYACNIACVLVEQGKYEDAIPYLQRDLQIRKRLCPNRDDLQLSTKYHNLAGAQFRLQKYNKALQNYQKCLEIELKLHSSTHPTIALTYCNMATVLEGLKRLEEAIETIEKAIEHLLLTRNENDEEIQLYKEYKKSLQQKLV
ncbi:unnamed protein product [Adineta steineri]|uniref:DUF4590 domain-containing protein n=1 Tax=Adineta steineri TaxID=433720 RepID=A0A818I435_9BILA|nr:unnamed protein product [Adineta steineri]CAF3513856.1 unnamed protein product [Adineta steineri]